MAVKSVTVAIPAVGAGANSGRTTVATPDDAVAREVIGVKSSLTTKGMTITFDNSGTPQAVIDAAILSQLTAFFPVDYQIPQNIQLSFSLANTTGGPLAAGDFITFLYKV